MPSQRTGPTLLLHGAITLVLALVAVALVPSPADAITRGRAETIAKRVLKPSGAPATWSSGCRAR